MEKILKSLKESISAIIGVAVVFLGAFGGFLKKIQPPESESDFNFSYGVSCFLTVLVILMLKITLKRRTAKKIVGVKIIAFISLVLFIASSIFYYDKYQNLTFLYPPTKGQKIRYMGGVKMHDLASKYMEERRFTPAQVVADNGGIDFRERVWPTNEIYRAKLILNGLYITLIFSLSMSFFSFIEIYSSK